MKSRILFFSGFMFFAPTFVYGACSVANLNRCLDSVCAININANPAARCQYCGSSNAGDPTTNTMKSVAVGAAARYTLSDKELKSAPKDPGERYVWGTKLCLEKVSGCTPDDVTDNYDKLIEQSCTAAGISTDMANLAKKTNTAKTQKECSDEIDTCIIDAKRCNPDYRNCESDESFDKYFADCGVLSTGCESFLSDIRTSVDSARKSTIANADKILQSIVTSYKNKRESELASAKSSCTNNNAKTDCVSRVCQTNMRNKCGIGYEYEKTISEQLCKFYDVACERLKQTGNKKSENE